MGAMQNAQGSASLPDALDTVDIGSAPADHTQEVGSALDSMDDPMVGQISSGSRMVIKSKEQFDALSEQQKAVIRAARDNGGTLRSSDALKVYMGAGRAQAKSEVREIPLPDGRKFYSTEGQLIQPAKPEEVKMDRVVDESGIVRMVNPVTGRSFAAWDETTGEPLRAQPKISESQRQEMIAAQSKVDQNSRRLETLNAFKDDQRVSFDDMKEAYVPSWFGSPVSSMREKDMNALRSAEEKLSRVGRRTPLPSSSQSAAPSASSSATPAATPSATPDPFKVGKVYKDRTTGATKTYRGNGVWE